MMILFQFSLLDFSGGPFVIYFIILDPEPFSGLSKLQHALEGMLRGSFKHLIALKFLPQVRLIYAKWYQRGIVQASIFKQRSV